MTSVGRVVEREPGWGQAESLYQPGRAAFWLFAILVVLGGPVLYHRITYALSVDTPATSLAFVIWGIYALPFFALIVWLDLLEPEPTSLLAAAFLWGAVVAVSLAMIANEALQSIITKVGGAEFTVRWYPAIAGPSTEEALKALGLVMVLLVARRQINTLLDGLVYGAVVGLGFQVSENFIFTADRIQSSAYFENPGYTMLEVVTLRGFGLGLWSHTVYSAIAGMGIAYLVVHPEKTWRRRVGIVALALAAACALHFLWNAPWWPAATGGLSWHLVPSFVVKGLPAVVLFALLYVMARRREVAWLDEVLGGESAEVSPDELSALRTPTARRRAVAAERRRGGRVAARRRRELQRTQIRLAVSLARAGDPAATTVVDAREEVRAARAALTATLESAPGPG